MKDVVEMLDFSGDGAVLLHVRGQIALQTAGPTDMVLLYFTLVVEMWFLQASCEKLCHWNLQCDVLRIDVYVQH